MPFHGPELIIIVVVALLIFGPKRLPEMGSSIGKSIKEFKKGMNELTSPKEEKEESVVKDDSASSLEAIEREIAAKKAAASAREAEVKQPEVEVGSKEKSVD